MGHQLDLFRDDSQNSTDNAPSKPKQLSLNLKLEEVPLSEAKSNDPAPLSHFKPKPMSKAHADTGYDVEVNSNTRSEYINGVWVTQKYILDKGWVTISEP
jgi:hypothetical protein